MSELVTDSVETLAEALTNAPCTCRSGTNQHGFWRVIDRTCPQCGDNAAKALYLITSGKVRLAAEVVTDLNAFLRLPRWTIVAQTWPYQGENAEPDLWRRVGSDYWQSLTDKGDDERYPAAAIWNGIARWRIVYNPALAEEGGR